MEKSCLKCGNLFIAYRNKKYCCKEKNEKKEKRNCLYCGIEISNKPLQQRYCDRKCYNRHYNRLRKIKADEKERLILENERKTGILELENFFVSIKNKNYLCDLVDCYRIIHYYTDIFGLKYTKLGTRDELELMRIELENWLEKNKINKDESY